MTRLQAIGAVLLAAATGFGAGAASGIRTRTVTATRTVAVPSVPPECRSALALASDGFGAAQQALSLARAANRDTPSGATATGPDATGSAAPASEAILSQATSRVQFLQRRYSETRNACEVRASATPPAEAPGSDRFRR